MDDLYLAYLDLLDGLCADLDRLSDLAKKKVEAVRRDDLMALDEVMKQEQALSLTLRGQEQKRQKLVTQLSLQDTKLAELPDRFPSGLYPRAKETVNNLHRSYGVYQAASAAARSTLEVNLHEVEKIIAASGVDTTAGAGYVPPNVQPPKNMKTDFRA